MRRNGFKKDLPALPPREFFHVYIINKLSYGFSERNAKTALSQLQKKLESLEGRMDALEKFKPGVSCLQIQFSVSTNNDNRFLSNY